MPHVSWQLPIGCTSSSAETATLIERGFHAHSSCLPATRGRYGPWTSERLLQSGYRSDGRGWPRLKKSGWTARSRRELPATMFNMPLTRLLVQIPESNADMIDRRMSAVVPVVFGGRQSVPLEVDWSIGLDITSILVLHYLDLLELVFEAFRRIKLAPDVMQCLFREQDSVRFHQPSRVGDGQQVRNLCNLQRIRLIDELEASGEVIVEEVGRELAALLRGARRDGGMVVCVLPIHRSNSLMEEEADTTDWTDLIVSVPDFCGLLFRQGRIDAATHERAQLFLRGQGPNRGAAIWKLRSWMEQSIWTG